MPLGGTTKDEKESPFEGGQRSRRGREWDVPVGTCGAGRDRDTPQRLRRLPPLIA
jgi:hypothetical protein